MYLTIANDIGNSETKMKVNDVLIKQPSVIKRLFQKPNVTETNDDKNVTNLLDELVVNITSNAIKRDGLYFVGKRANITADQVDNMSIVIGGKYKHDIPVIMTLSMISARAIQLHYQEKKEMPSIINLDLLMTTAIPSSEFSHDKAKQLEKRFLDNDHVVIVYVGEKAVTVKLNFEHVKVTQEGVPALFALLESDKEILKEYNQFYKKNVQPRDFKDKKIFHVDIGDGTTEYIYTIGVNPVNDACSGERRGVGHATEEALKLLKDEVGGYLNINRQQFVNILRDHSHNLHGLAIQFMSEARYLQANKILEDILEKYKNKTAGNVDVIAVYGGGSIQFEEELKDELLEFAKEVHCEVLWIPEKYAVNMNVNGMQVLNDKIFSKQKQSEGVK